MSIKQQIRKIFGQKPKIKVVTVTAIGGKECPVCHVQGLFSYPDYFICEECLSVFDKEMKLKIKKIKFSMSEQQPIVFEVENMKQIYITQIIKQKVVVCLLVTRKYHVFVQPLIDSICKYFLLRHEIEINLFTDNLEIEYHGDERVKIVKELIPSYSFPTITLYRYAIMTSKKYSCDFLYYLDVDYLIVSEIDEEIFGNLVAVLHPGFSCVGGGSWCDDKNSNAYTFPENRVQYFCGGTSGGMYEIYYKAMHQMKLMIEDDEKRGVKAEHNDESHWNKFLSERNSFKILDSSYCYVQQPHLQKAWKIDHLKPKILALEKQHELIRN